MIPANKIQGALFSLNAVLVLIRQMAYDERDHKTIATVLDLAEQLPRFIGETADRTQEFRVCLEDLSSRNSEFFLALERFDNPPARW